MKPDEFSKQFLLINKPAGWTSFDVVNYVRKKVGASTVIPVKTGIQTLDSRLRGNDNRRKRPKVGHAGTLDPFATGLLIVGIGREATKRLDEFKKLPKTYVATLHLGAVSDTYDVTGKIRNMIHDTRKTIHNNNETAKQWSNEKPNEKQILFTLESFKGKQLQTPPMHSAKKVGGVRLYKLARQGKEIEREAVPIEMYDIKLLEYEWPRLKIEVTCSAGTYIRSLANDIGEKLGVGAYCEALTRTKIGDYTLEQAHELAAVDRLFS
ncbi:MAG TPA: tRNA pseudouridine(55) synthase TruB [Patescibacteria group bacterium]|nr:tRNA pseudouridine(55) synthase TruB [Patescibacteria group bacterium]